jgi:tripartite-type tricarboxylate transporter receptor subunit TctC
LCFDFNTKETMKREMFLKLVAAGVMLAAAYPAVAEKAYPTKPNRFVVPYPPGGPTDLMARLLQPELQTRLGVRVVVENKSGAGGNVGRADVAKQAPADGSSLLLAASGPMAVNPSLYKSMAFDPMKDLAPVIQSSSFALVLEVHPKMGIKTLKELIALAKRPDSKRTFASAGNGTLQHLAGEMFNTQLGINLSHAPYRGAGPAPNDMLVGGHVDVMFDILGRSLPHLQGGRLVPLAVTSAQRQAALPNVPTRVEAGVEGCEFTAWHGIAVRAGTPATAITKLNTLNAIFSDAEFKKKWAAIGTPVVGGSPQQFGEPIRKDSVRLGEVVKRVGVTVD